MPPPNPSIPASLSPPLAALFHDYLNPKLSLPDLAAAHNIPLLDLLNLLQSPPFLEALRTLDEATTTRIAAIHTATAANALARIAAT
jgi:hypothetical protein